MILWTIQREAAALRLERTGTLWADGRRVCKAYRPAYRWIVAQMGERIGPPPARIRYPIWAWRIWTPRSPTPDLRSRGHLPPGTRGVRIEFEAAADRVLASDFDGWHAVLNHPFGAEHERDDERGWGAIFDLGGGRSDYRADPFERSVQATLWSLELHQVHAMTRFVAR
jgi:hypothetical protein